jgi:hypothetical protein
MTFTFKTTSIAITATGLAFPIKVIRIKSIVLASLNTLVSSIEKELIVARHASNTI